MRTTIRITGFVMVWLLAASCFHRMAPAGKGGTYNQQANTTTYQVAPYGSMTFPGKWEGGKYSKASRHQYFYHADTSTLVAAIGPCSSLPFGKEQLEGYRVAERYYQLELQYQAVQGHELKLIEESSEKQFVMWLAHIDGIDQYFLFGVKTLPTGECTYRQLTLKTRKMTPEAKVKFLRDIFLGE